jgi:hypothetical protein
MKKIRRKGKGGKKFKVQNSKFKVQGFNGSTFNEYGIMNNE